VVITSTSFTGRDELAPLERLLIIKFLASVGVEGGGGEEEAGGCVSGGGGDVFAPSFEGGAGVEEAKVGLFINAMRKYPLRRNLNAKFFCIPSTISLWFL